MLDGFFEWQSWKNRRDRDSANLAVIEYHFKASSSEVPDRSVFRPCD